MRAMRYERVLSFWTSEIVLYCCMYYFNYFVQYISMGFCHLEFVAPGSVPQGLEPVPLQLARFAVGRVTRCRDRGLGV